MRSKAKKLLVLVLTLSLVATFIAPLPVARGQEKEGITIALGAAVASVANATAVDDPSAPLDDDAWYFENPTAKFEIYLTPQMLGINDDLTVDGIKTISYWTKKTEDAPQDFFLCIYTATDGSDDEGTWYGYRLTAEPYFSKGYTNANVGTWTKWTTDETASDATNTYQLTFYDSAKIGDTAGFYGQPSLQDLQQTSSFNWSTWCTEKGISGCSTQEIDYGKEKVKYISFQTGSAWSSTFSGYIDYIYIELTTGHKVTVDLKNMPDTVYVDSTWSKELPGEDPDGEGPATSYAYDAFSKIQDAIDYVEPGGTVYINPGTYIEDLTIDKPVNLIGVSDEGDRPTIQATASALKTDAAGTYHYVVQINPWASGTNIENIRFVIPASILDTISTSSATIIDIVHMAYHEGNGVVVPGLENIYIKNSSFELNTDSTLRVDVRGIYFSRTGGSTRPRNITLENCTFKGPFGPTISGYLGGNLTIKHSTIENALSGINIQGSGLANLIMENTSITVLAKDSDDAYAVRVGTNDPTTKNFNNLSITGGTFQVIEQSSGPTAGKYHSAIIIRSGAQGDLNIKEATIEGEVVNLSTATLYASGNYWGTDGPFGATFAGSGPIVIENWLDRNGNEVDLVSGAQKVPAHGSTGVSPNAEVKIVFPSNATISVIDEENLVDIAIESANGSTLDGVTATLIDNSAIISHPSFAYGTQYTVNVPGGTFKATLGEDANVQVLAEQPTSWSFTTAARPLPPPPPPPPEELTPPGAEEPLPDTVIEEAINQAEETGKVVLTAPGGQETLALTVDQLATIEETEKPLVVNIGEVQIELPAVVVSTLAGVEAAQVEINVAELSTTAGEELHEQAANANQYNLAGTVYEISIELVKPDGSREDAAGLGGKAKVHLPVPSDKQDLAAAGLLTVARFNENTEAWEEIPSTFDEDTKCMIFETTHFSKYAILEKVLDTAAPTVVNTDPVDNATNVPIDKVIKVTFNEDVVSATNFDKITLADTEGATVAVTTTLTAGVLTITPSDPLDYSTEYTVTIPAGAVKDAAGNPLPEDVSFSFTTMAEPDTTAPEVKSTDPANGAVDVALDKVIKVTFTEDVVEGDEFANIVLKDGTGQKMNAKVELSGSVLTISPSSKLDYSTKYTVVIPAGAVKDAAANPLKDEYTFSFTTASFPTKTFDDIQGHWAQHDIEIMAGLGIAKGVGDNKFNPDASITRAEFVALLVRSMDITAEPVSETSFKDVAPDAWYAAEVEAAHKVGIAIGFEDGTFRPYAQVTREQIAAFIVRAMNWTVEEEEVDALLSRFTDQAKISSWAKKEVAAAVQKGIVLGRPDGTFDPQANATRAEAVVMLKRVLQAAGVIPPNV